jgi:hypothetical protein
MKERENAKLRRLSTLALRQRRRGLVARMPPLEEVLRGSWPLWTGWRCSPSLQTLSPLPPHPAGDRSPTVPLPLPTASAHSRSHPAKLAQSTLPSLPLPTCTAAVITRVSWQDLFTPLSPPRPKPTQDLLHTRGAREGPGRPNASNRSWDQASGARYAKSLPCYWLPLTR